MKKSKYFTIISFLSLTLALSGVASAAGELKDANAFYYNGGFKDISVTENMKYYIPSYTWDQFGDYIDDSFSDFSSISGVNFGFEEVSWLEDADLFIVDTDEDGTYDGLPGIMIPCNWSGSTCNKVSYNSRWELAAVFLLPDNMEREDFSSINRHKTVLHEIGHAYALEHQPKGVNSVMVPGKLTITSPTSLDISNLKWKY
ncbi:MULTISPECIES: hypothetical protein [Brevibacillus]|uniref:Peptidase M10 metallopeptidase domain-containing protein n=1 Tax=Brevibacillus invocatus TaxID=173959 RepID=A0A3M8CGD6_9BACL|nr:MULTISPECIES: hypothetical protein [Brevibacillus]MCM3079014.1 hypothetical protein [Brevibacillus invocatus]MCM3429923.1 hypothetical protein [Brevibacillus invocatus]MDH4617120.1 hypothetical protein [Brevibacillus sp. AY1]RNB74810.1 hypothetical protein EDM52_08780 [Brevibacillus invocatus]